MLEATRNTAGADEEAVAGRHALLSGGGSGGHVFPALAVGAALGRRGWRVSYAGSASGPEARLAAEAGLEFFSLPARPLVGQGPIAKAVALLTLGRSAFSARRLVRREDVDSVVSTGGYAGLPAVVGARLARRPVLLVEPNAQAGLANRAASRFATEAMIAYPSTGAALRCRSTVTGVPVRDVFHEVPALEIAALPRPFSILVLGGSQGARQLNLLMPPALAAFGDTTDLIVVHQAGPARLDEAELAYRSVNLPASIRVDVVPFIEDMAAAMGRAHLVISRAGAITLAELCAAGRPSILVPLALAGGHQADNAQALGAAGAAFVLLGDVATPGALAAHLRDLAAGADLGAMAKAARGLARRDAAEAIADRVDAVVGRAA